MPSHRYPINCHLMLKAHDDIGRIHWASNVRNLLYKYSFGFVWISQDVGDITMFYITLNNGHSDIDTSTKWFHYKQFITSHIVERYITCSLPFHLRQTMAKFRCSNHKLNIEVCRHAGIQRELGFASLALYRQIKTVLKMNNKRSFIVNYTMILD